MSDEITELRDELRSSSLYNEDLAPVPHNRRTWGLWNIAANVVSPSNDFSNLAPRHVSFKMGGLITGVIGILIFPWKLLTDFNQYIFTWLVGYSGLLGSVAGVMIADYYLLRRTRLQINDLYQREGTYSYGGSGFNWRALAAVSLGISINIPGFLAQASGGTIEVAPFFSSLYDYAWFLSLLIAGLAYMALNSIFASDAID